MNRRPDLPQVLISVDLARELDFVVGEMAICPSRRQVAAAGKQVTVQPRVMRVFVALVRAKGAVLSREELIESCWDSVIVGDDAINACIAKVRQIAELSGGKAFEIETIPRVGYRLKAGMSEPSTQQDIPGAPSQACTVDLLAVGVPPKRWTRRRMVLAGAGAAAAASATAFGFWRVSRHEVPPAANVRIAVMPFRSLAGNASQDYLARGLAEEVMTSLNRIPHMRAAARTSSFMIPPSAAVTKIAQTLGATHVLYGTILPRRSSLRIDVTLVDASSEDAIWSSEYNLGPTEIAGVEDHIALDAAEVLAIYAAPIGTYDRGNPTPEALDLYFRGRDAFFFRGPENVARSIAYFEAAVRNSPKFGKALAALGAAYAQYLFEVPASEQNAMIAKALAVAEMALKLDPRLGDAYAVKAQLLPPFGNWSHIEDLLNRGLAQDPENVTLLSLRSQFLMSVGRNADALVGARTLFALDPLCPFMTSTFVRALIQAGEQREAGDRFSYADRLWPNHFLFWELRSFFELEGGNDFQHSRNTPLAVPQEISTTQDVSLFWQVQRARQDSARVQNVSHSILASAATGQESAHRAIRLLCDLNRPEAALSVSHTLFAEKGCVGGSAARFYAQWPHREVWPVHLFAPSTGSLRAQPGFDELVRSIGLTAYWIRGTSPDGCDAAASSWCMATKPI